MNEARLYSMMFLGMGISVGYESKALAGFVLVVFAAAWFIASLRTP